VSSAALVDDWTGYVLVSLPLGQVLMPDPSGDNWIPADMHTVQEAIIVLERKQGELGAAKLFEVTATDD